MDLSGKTIPYMALKDLAHCESLENGVGVLVGKILDWHRELLNIGQLNVQSFEHLKEYWKS